MPRTRKKTETVLNQDTFSDEDAGLLTEKPVVVTERHRVVREWSENKPVGDEGSDDDDGIDDVVEDVAEIDPIALVAQEMASSQHNWTLRVDRLPEYETTGKSGVGYRKFCGFVPIPSADWLRDQCYLEEIQSRWARVGECNSFAICIRKGSVIFRYLPIVSVEPAPATSLPGLGGVPVDGSTINVYGNQQNPLDMMESVAKQLAVFQKLQASMLPPWMKNFDPIAAIPQQQQPAAATTESALMTLLNSNDELVDVAVSKLRKLFRGESGGGSEEKGPWDAVVALLTSPTLPQTISTLVAQFREPQNHQATANQPTDIPPPVSPDVAAYQRLLTVLTNAMRLNGDVATALAALDGFTALFPEHAGNVEGFLAANTQQLLQGLVQFYPPAAGVVGLPHAVEWVEKLKTAYFGEEPSNGEPVSISQ